MTLSSKWGDAAMKRSRLVLLAIALILTMAVTFVSAGAPAYAVDGNTLDETAQVSVEAGDVSAAQQAEDTPVDQADPSDEAMGDASEGAPEGAADESQEGAPQEAQASDPSDEVIPAETEEVSLTAADDGTEAKAERTIMLYVCGSDLESYSGLASYNLRQVLSASFSKDENIRFLVMTTGAEAWFLEEDYLYDPKTQSVPENGIDVGWNQIWEAKGVDAAENPGKLVLVDSGPQFKVAEDEEGWKTYEGLATDPETIKYFINYCAENYPAEKYDLILWDHGGGPIDSYGPDFREDSPKPMILADLLEAFQDNAVTKDGGKFDFVNFDACLMGSVEVMLTLADYTDYYICSPENVPGFGEEYSGWLNLLGQNPTIDTYTLGKRIVDDFLEFYNEDKGGDANTKGTICLVNTRKMLDNGFVDSLNDLVGLLSSAAKNAGTSTGEVLFYDELRANRGSLSYGKSPYRDLGNFVSQLAVDFYELTKDDVVDDTTVDMTNDYVPVAKKLNELLANEEIFYAGATDTMDKGYGLYRNSDGEVKYDDMPSSGLHIFFPNPDYYGDVLSDYGRHMELAINALDTSRISPASLAFLMSYRDAMYDYAIIAYAGRTVNDMINVEGMDRSEINFETFRKYLLTPDIEDYPSFNNWNSVIAPLLQRVYFIDNDDDLPDGYPDIPEEEVQWLDRLVRQQAAEAISKDDVISTDITEENGTGHRVRIENTRQRQIRSVNTNVLAELPTVEEFFNLPEYKDYRGYMTDEDEKLLLSLGTIEGTLDTFASDGGETSPDAGGDFLEEYINNFITSTTSTWDLAAFEGKWYAVRDAKGELHVADCNPYLDPYVFVTYSKEGSEAKEPLLLLFSQDDNGVFTLSDLCYVNEESGLRPIPVSELKGQLEVTSSTIITPFLDKLFVPVSKTSFVITADNASSIQIVYEDIANLSDIEDTDGDGEAVRVSYVAKDIYDHEIDITKQVNEAKGGTKTNIRLAKPLRATYNGHEQAPTLTYDGKVLKEGEGLDYTWEKTFESDDLTNVGEHYIDVFAEGGEFIDVVLAVPFYIDPAPISQVSIAGIADKTYTGAAITQTPVLTFGDLTLVEGVDYDVTYRDNVEVGTATIVFTGKGNFTGETTVTFAIKPAGSPDDSKDITPEPTPKPTPKPKVLPKTDDPASEWPIVTLAVLGGAMIFAALLLRPRHQR